MNKQTFQSLVIGDQITFRGEVLTIVDVERFAVSPNVRQTSSITTQDGRRAKEDDDLSQLFIHQRAPEVK